MQIEYIFIFSAGGVLGYLTRLIIEHFLAKDRSRQNRIAAIFNAGAIAFKKAFVDEIDFLRNYGESTTLDDTAYATLHKAYGKHKNALEAFCVHLDSAEIEAIRKAWENYLYPDADHEEEEGDEFILMGYYTDVDEPGQRKRALENINKLLEHAKPK